MKIIKGIIKVVVSFAVVYAAFVAGYNLKTSGVVVETNPFVQLEQDPRLVELADKLGINYSQLNLKYVDTVDAGNLDNADGVFIYPNTIQIDKDVSNPLQLLAHEYTHYWVSQNSSAPIVRNYDNFLSKDPWIQETLRGYNCDKLCLADEANAYACTVYPPYLLTAEFNGYCDSIIPNRSVLYSY